MLQVTGAAQECLVNPPHDSAANEYSNGPEAETYNTEFSDIQTAPETKQYSLLGSWPISLYGRRST
ncbi:hypothetical protein PFI31113_00871 [Pandoraea fibrosis]|uniref:Uncharacterized protein n=1 Tax=Pandoraea fibrosis TaxID=1891094 RepID=A0A5E4SL09_9BURK|nr:hypothetical protein PFI31113_00871 [Pandoraea fibrosis]